VRVLVCQTTLATVLAERLATRMRKKLFRSIVAQELAFFDNSRKGELLSRLSLDISTAQVGTLLPPTKTCVAYRGFRLTDCFPVAQNGQRSSFK
jgi:ABC-type siderophore export system fused ATPase/permease subunit